MPNKVIEAEHILELSQQSALAILQLSLFASSSSKQTEELAVSPFTILLAAFGILLSKYSGEEDISFGSCSASSNPLVLRLNLPDTLTVNEILTHVMEVCS